MPDTTFTLKCFACEKEVAIIGPRPTMAIDIIEASRVAGWKAVQDVGRYRVLVFCTDPCIEAATTKKGDLRLRMPKKKVGP